MALIAEHSDGEGAVETLGVARVSADPDNVQAEFAILVRSDFKRHGLGSLLLGKLIHFCRDRGISRMMSSVLSGNAGMLGLGAALGFTTQFTECGIMEMSLDLHACEASRRVGSAKLRGHEE